MSIWRRLEHEPGPASVDLDSLNWNDKGLVTAVAQHHESGAVLMLAWMNREALVETLDTGWVCYWSRSRKRLWRKGETSGNRQRLVEARLDCDADAVLLLIDPEGPACHTLRESCFYNIVSAANPESLEVNPLEGPDRQRSSTR